MGGNLLEFLGIIRVGYMHVRQNTEWRNEQKEGYIKALLKIRLYQL
jgi:hypothetical protein